MTTELEIAAKTGAFARSAGPQREPALTPDVVNRDRTAPAMPTRSRCSVRIEMAPGDWEIRAMVPQARRRSSIVAPGDAAVLARWRGVTRPAFSSRGWNRASALPTASCWTTGRNDDAARADPYEFGPDPRRPAALASIRTSAARGLPGSRRAPAHGRRRLGIPIRGLGADGEACQRGRRLQRLGRSRPSDATAPRLRRLGAVRSRTAPGQRYKFEVKGPDGSLLPQRADPIAFATEQPPATASVLHGLATVSGETAPGWPTAARSTRARRRYRSTNAISAPGRECPRRTTAISPIANWRSG